MSPEALRALVLAVGATLIGVAEFDDMLVTAGIPALGILSAGVSKILFAVGTFAVGYAKTGKLFGDFSIKDAIGAQLKDASAPKPELK